MDLLILALRISVGMSAFYALKIGISYYFGGVEKGGKVNEVKRFGR